MNLGRRLKAALRVAEEGTLPTDEDDDDAPEESTRRPSARKRKRQDEEPPSILALIDEVLDHREKIDGDRRAMRYFRPSALFGCKRAAVFFYTNAPAHPQRQDARMRRHLDVGTHLHKMIQSWLAEHTDWFFAPETHVMQRVAGAWIRGHCDGVLIHRKTGRKIGIEIKTKTHSAWLKINKPVPWEARQASIYAKLQDLDVIVMVYYDKDKQAVKEFAVRPSKKVWDTVVNRVTLLRSFVDRKKLPVFNPADCDTTFCGFVDHCRRKGAPV